MIWFSALATWLNSISQQQINLNKLGAAVALSGNSRTAASIRNVKSTLSEIEAIQTELHQLEKELDCIEQLERITNNLKRKKMCEEIDTPVEETPTEPVVTDEKVENQEEKNHGTFGKPA